MNTIERLSRLLEGDATFTIVRSDRKKIAIGMTLDHATSLAAWLQETSPEKFRYTVRKGKGRSLVPEDK